MDLVLRFFKDVKCTRPNYYSCFDHSDFDDDDTHNLNFIEVYSKMLKLILTIFETYDIFRSIQSLFYYIPKRFPGTTVIANVVKKVPKRLGQKMLTE